MSEERRPPPRGMGWHDGGLPEGDPRENDPRVQRALKKRDRRRRKKGLARGKFFVPPQELSGCSHTREKEEELLEDYRVAWFTRRREKTDKLKGKRDKRAEERRSALYQEEVKEEPVALYHKVKAGLLASEKEEAVAAAQDLAYKTGVQAGEREERFIMRLFKSLGANAQVIRDGPTGRTTASGSRIFQRTKRGYKVAFE